MGGILTSKKEECRDEEGLHVSLSMGHDERPSIRKVEGEQRPTSVGKVLISPPPRALQHNSQSQNRQLRPPYANPDTLRSYSEPFSSPPKAVAQDPPQKGTEAKRAPPPPPLKLASTSGASAVPGRHGKSRFNLRNPMSLLARRRSHQAVTEAKNEKEQYKSAYPPVPSLPEDFDPRIRGKVVHDFSAPRPGTNKSSQSMRDADRVQREAILYNSRKTSPNPSTACVDEDSPSSGEREHTPQFTEHFDDDLGPAGGVPAKKRTSTFMYQVSLSEAQSGPDPSVLPPFARRLPSNITTAAPTVPKTSSPPPKEFLEIVPETGSTDAVPRDISLPSAPPKSPPVKPRSRASSNTESPYQPAGLPKHFKSNASRFSFDLAGVGSAAQEKLLEEKHRENERKKARSSHGSQLPESDIADDDEYDDEFNNMDEDDGLEEKIPGINADVDESSILGAQQHTQDIDFISPNKSSFTSAPSLASTGITSPNTPRDSVDRPANLSIDQNSPGLSHMKDVEELRSGQRDEKGSSDGVGGHILHGAPVSGSKYGVNVSEVTLPGHIDDDDLYFDDGMIEDFDVQEEHAFDELVFDDDTSRVYGLPPQDQKPLQALGDADDQPDGDAIRQVAGSLINPERSTDGMADLTAYHDALAVKVNQAAMNGEFARRPSLDPSTDGISNSNAGLPDVGVPLNEFNIKQAGGLLIGGDIDDGDDFSFDDAVADDPIIAAANAEALENDDEGFYGQEFGFFARASGAGEAEYANGGYFGSRGFEVIGRSHSGRVNEPSLTPITERSELSNRNSAISLAMHGFQPPSAGPQPSPGLAQLADMMHLEENDMSLSALMKLRRGAWGGSNASLHSSSSGSPLTYVPSVGFPAAIPTQHSNSSNGNLNLANGSPLTMHSAHTFASSSYSLNSSNGFTSSNENSPGSATVTVAAQQQALPDSQPPQSAPAFLPQPPQRRSMSPVKRSMGPPPKPKKGHSRNSSTASGSVSYVHEAAGEDGGQGRWVLEKRRVGESGVVEVLGREIVEGGRI